MIKHKTLAISIAFLMLTITIPLIALPAVNAHTPAWKIPTFAYVLAVPNPIGVGQATWIYMWIDKMPDGTAIANDWRMHNYKLTITKPDGATEVKTWDTIWDTTSSQGFSYTPDQVGTYVLKFEFPGQDANAYSYNPASAFLNDTYLPSSSTMNLVVQEDSIVDLPSSYPLPEEYWTRPIYGENPGWWIISSDWLGTGSPQLSKADRFIAGGLGSQTAHVMWTKPLQSGGVVGGDDLEIQGDTYFEGSAYISRYRNPIIVAGKLYYKEPLHFSSANGGPTVCVDLRTGKELWRRTDVPSLSFAMIYATHQPNQHGVMQPILSTNNFGMCFDADTGNWIFNYTDVPSGTAALGPQGEQVRYVITNLGSSANPNWYLAQWNSSKPFYSSGGWQVLTPSVSGVKNASGSNNYDWNVSIPWRNTMSSSFTVLDAWCNDMMLCREGDLTGMGNRGSAPDPGVSYHYFAVNLNPSKGAIGSVLWKNTIDPAPGNISVLAGTADPTSRVFTETYKETMQWVGYSMDSGQKLWGPTPSQASLDYYGYFFPGLTGVPAYGKLYSSGMAGIVYCYDETTGEVVWTYGGNGAGNSTNSGFQVPGPYPTFIYGVANGIVYTMTTEHTIQTPIYKGAAARGINATDGTEVWTLSNHNGGGVSAVALAEGFNTFFNGYDDQIYVVGKGPSTTTVTASPKVTTFGSSIEVEGTVIDAASGTAQAEQAARFPNGVPAVSDKSMTEWMEYVYQQKPRPTNAIGVQVSLDVIDANGNYRNIGTATSDTNGFFHYNWKPDIPGEYKLTATFAGSQAYWPSHAETAFAIDSAIAPNATEQPVIASPPFEMYFLASTIAIIAAIAVVGLLLLRKRP